MQLGSVVYNSTPPLGSAGPFSGAVNGVSQNPAGKVVLGNDAGGTLATLTSSREIPMAGFSILFSGVGQTATGVPTFKQDATILGNTPDLLFQQSDGQEAGRIRFISSVAGDAGDIMMGRLAGSTTTTVDSRMYFGWRAGELATNAALGSTAFGYETLRLVTGINNHAFGNQALHNITSGANDCAFGKNTALNADILSQCLFVGNFAGPAVWGGRACDNNVMIGHAAGNALASAAFTATGNTFIGSLVFQSSGGGYGNNNIMIGFNALNAGGSGAIGNDCIFIGANTQVNGITNSGILGTGVFLFLNNVFIVGNPTQNVMIGISSPAADNGSRLQVNGDISTRVAGNALRITEGANGRAGQVALVAGTINVAIASVTVNSRAFVTRAISNTTAATVEYRAVCTAGNLAITADIAAGTINVADISTLNYIVIN